MRRRLLALSGFALLTLVVSGCSGVGRLPNPINPPPPGSGGVYTGEPTRMVVIVPGESARNSLRLMALPAHASSSLEAIIRIVNYQSGTQIYERFESRPYDPASGAAVEVEVPASLGYEVSAVVHGSGLKSLGLVSNIGAAAGETTEVEVPVGPPTYQVSAPSVAYQGGSVLQFRAWSDHPMYRGNTDVLIGMQPWNANTVEAFWDANDPRSGGWGAISLGTGGVVGPSTFPSVEVDTTLYYQVRVCVKPMYTGGVAYCYYEPDVEALEPLWTAVLSAGAPE